MESAWEMAQSADNLIGVDQSLITLFNKMLDPKSVVRMSEYMRTEENTSLLSRLTSGFTQKISGGAKISDSDRKALVDMAREFETISKEDFTSAHNEYLSLAEEMGVEDADAFFRAIAEEGGIGGIDTTGFGLQEGEIIVINKSTGQPEAVLQSDWDNATAEEKALYSLIGQGETTQSAIDKEETEALTDPTEIRIKELIDKANATENQADKQRYLDMAEAIDRPAYTKVLKWMGETGASLGETLLDFFSF